MMGQYRKSSKIEAAVLATFSSTIQLCMRIVCPSESAKTKSMRFMIAMALFLSLQTTNVLAQSFQASQCRPVAQHGPRLIHASFEQSTTLVQSGENAVELTYLSHAQFRITDSSGLHIATDYTGFDASLGLPTIATMNTVHDGHHTFDPNPEIPHVLQGWKKDGKPSRHHLIYDDVVIRNITTDFTLERIGYRADENSIFIIEVAGLCIGHLGQLHELPTEEQYADIGRLDVVLIQVDGMKRMDLNVTLELLQRLGARMIIPMHWHDRRSLLAYLERMEGHFPIDGRNESSVTLSIKTLPKTPTMLVLTPMTSFPIFN